MRSILSKLLERARSGRDAAPAMLFEALYAQALNAAATQNFERALELFDQALVLDSSHAEAYYKRGNTLRSLGRLDAAVASYNQAIERKNDYAHAYCNRGVVQQSLALMTEAAASYDRALAFDPDDAMVHYNRALLSQECFRWEEAIASYDRAISIDPGFADAQYNRSMALLYCGDFARGWPGYEWRWKNAQRLRIGMPRNFTEPLWLGAESIAGKRLLLQCEGGLGDTLQFCRYAPLIGRMSGVVILQIQAPLIKLLGKLDGVSQVIELGKPLPLFDYHCPLMSLPLAFKTTLQSIPAASRYLDADDDKVARWLAQMERRGRPRIGLVWSGNPAHTNDHNRSIRLADCIDYLPREFQYISLQTEIRPQDEEVLAHNPWIETLLTEEHDFSDTAALCECMDLVISVDTSPAHLGAALGRPTWILLPLTADWRWLRSGEDSPWYPTVRLYRQRVARDWGEVLARVAADLRREFGGE